MNRTGILATLLAAAAAAQGTDIEQVIVRQQWPWSTDVKVEYRLSGVSASAPVDISVTAYNGGTELDGANLAAAMHGDLYGVTKPVGTITIDPVKAFGTGQIALDDFKVKLTLSTSAANIHETLYKIFDLTNGCACTDVTRADLLSRRYGAVETDFGKIGPGFNTSLDDVIIWTGVTNDVKYKTTHLVMRKIPAKGKSFTMGLTGDAYYKTQEAASQTAHNVSFTNDYYAGVFELTYGQATNIAAMGASVTTLAMWFTNTADNALRPLNCGYTSLRKSLENWPIGGRAETTNYSMLKKLRDATGLMFDLPTEAIWEYACRAGTTTDFNCGVIVTSANSQSLQMQVSRCMHNSSMDYRNLNAGIDKNLTSEVATAMVGSYAPNAWGLYDMHGNVNELCLDYYQADISSFTGDDPWGGVPNATPELTRVTRGGSFQLSAQFLTSSYRMSRNVTHTTCIYGARMFIVVYD